MLATAITSADEAHGHLKAAGKNSSLKYNWLAVWFSNSYRQICFPDEAFPYTIHALTVQV